MLLAGLEAAWWPWPEVLSGRVSWSMRWPWPGSPAGPLGLGSFSTAFVAPWSGLFRVLRLPLQLVAHDRDADDARLAHQAIPCRLLILPMDSPDTPADGSAAS